MKTVIPVLAIFLASCAPQSSPKTASEIARTTAAYLWSQQDDDGGWHSGTHGIASGGEAWTPFIFFHLMAVPDSIYQPDDSKRELALEFLRARISESGILGQADPIVSDYPNYATSYAVRVFVENDDARDASRVERMVEYLRKQQMTEQRGFAPEDEAYGAWGFGEKNLAQGSPGHVDLSHTRRVVQALRAVDDSDLSLSQALTFLHRLQKRSVADASRGYAYDGGFFASPIVVGVNKGGYMPETDSTDGFYRSYATATADGLLALLAAGVPKTDERVVDAYEWLLKKPSLERPAGIPDQSAIRWDNVMVFYHLYARSEVYHALNESSNWQVDMVRFLEARQLENGSFANPLGSPNKEDDPLIASTFALSTLISAIDS